MTILNNSNNNMPCLGFIRRTLRAFVRVKGILAITTTTIYQCCIILSAIASAHYSVLAEDDAGIMASNRSLTGGEGNDDEEFIHASRYCLFPSFALTIGVICFWVLSR
jgi:hypothetical protein